MINYHLMTVLGSMCSSDDVLVVSLVLTDGTDKEPLRLKT